MAKERWVINRAGLLNFWYYDEEIFQFDEGCLLLRGSNGSGKSVTMQSFLPLLLDGDKSPSRLDAFGSRDRKLENYLLREDDSREENVGYLFMEFRRMPENTYLTVGMGLRAIRGRDLQSWGFALTDGRRIGHDFFLYRQAGEKILLSKTELRNRIGEGGRVCDTTGEYMRMVNQQLFGFAEIEEFEKLMKLILQLRTPKLSRDFKPTSVYDILENALQPLSEEDLRPMSEAIENMDQLKNRHEQLQRGLAATERIAAVYDRYNAILLREKAQHYVRQAEQLQQLKRQQETMQQKLQTAQEGFRQAGEMIEQYSQRLKLAEQQKESLSEHDSVQLKMRLGETEQSLESVNREKAEKESLRQDKKQKLFQVDDRLRKARSAVEADKERIQALCSDMSELSADFRFDEHEFMIRDLHKDLDRSFSFAGTHLELQRREKTLSLALQAAQQEHQSRRDYDRAYQGLEQRKRVHLEKQTELEKALDLVAETRKKMVENLYRWQQENREMKLEEEMMVALSRRIMSIEEQQLLGSVALEVEPRYRQLYERIDEQRDELRQRLQAQREALERWQEERAKWLQAVDPEPPCSPEQERFHRRLQSEGIPCLPLYKALDFRAELSETERDYVEAALLDMGLLNALVLPPDFAVNQYAWQEDEAGRWLHPDRMRDTFGSASLSLTVDWVDLMEALQPESPPNLSGFDNAWVERTLRAIGWKSETDCSLSGEGFYRLGPLGGKTPSAYRAKYIGAQARLRWRQQRISELNALINPLEKDVAGLENEIDDLERRQKLLNEEKYAFPSLRDLELAFRERSDWEMQTRLAEGALKEQQLEERRLYKLWQEKQRDLLELIRPLQLAGDEATLREALASLRDYERELNRLESLHKQYLNQGDTIASLRMQEEELEADGERLGEELSRLDRQISFQEQSRRHLQEQLEHSDFEQIQQQLESCLQQLRELPPLLDAQRERRGAEKNAVEQTEQELQRLAIALRHAEELESLAEEILREELRLAYVEEADEERFVPQARRLASRQGDANQDAATVLGLLQDRFYNNIAELREYSLEQHDRFSVFLTDDMDDEIRRLQAHRSRRTLMAKVRGSEVNFYQLLDFLRQGVEESANLLRESDRILFEDILTKNISTKIKAKIFISENWVEKMDGLLKSMHTSSGLSLSLQWRKKTAEQEGQLNTEELVNLLKREPTLLTKQELDKLAEHFRSKIDQARARQGENGQTRSFHALMREALDYRRWFEFKLFYVKPGQNGRRELTDRAFNQFSGGEKAMAMYAPLFAAVNACYMRGRADCPKIIALDEAFAGVDDNNIHDMFRMMRDMDLDYTLNSQSLWGDYESVPALAICELHFDKERLFVTVERFHWNGHSLVQEEVAP